jgi:hypothetical protein
LANISGAETHLVGEPWSDGLLPVSHEICPHSGGSILLIVHIEQSVASHSALDGVFLGISGCNLLWADTNGSFLQGLLFAH